MATNWFCQNGSRRAPLSVGDRAHTRAHISASAAPTSSERAPSSTAAAVAAAADAGSADDDDDSGDAGEEKDTGKASRPAVASSARIGPTIGAREMRDTKRSARRCALDGSAEPVSATSGSAKEEAEADAEAETEEAKANEAAEAGESSFASS